MAGERYPRDMATVTAAPLRIEDAAGVRTLVLNRPERRNALSLALLRDLQAALADTAADVAVHVVVVRGEGPAFCAGHDLSEMTGCSLPAARELFDACSDVMMAIHRLPQPVIAQVHGVATAAGCQLVAACDLAVASEDARFATPGVRIGLFCSTPMVEVSRAVGRKRALEMLLTGELIDAQTAADWGLVNRVVPREQLGAAALDLAGRIASASSDTLAVGKVAFYEQLDRPLPQAYEHASEVMAGNAVTPDAREGIDAFLSKREPQWRGREN
jgi:enoyl-CoA hydratase/carnithine racemase